MSEAPPLLLLRDGPTTVSYRRLGSGPRRLLFFHGFPGSCVQITLFNPAVAAGGLEVVCLDRPGHGMSSEAPSRSGQLAEGIRQCELVLRELGWERFEILAVSGGTPLGLSVAGALGERVVRTTVACGLGPVGEREFFGQLSPTSRAALRLLPFLPRRALGAALPAWVLRFLFPASAADKEVLADAGVWLALMQAKTEAWAQGGAGPLADAACFLSDWGRRLGKIPGGVRFFHGQEDRVIAPEMSRLLARRLESDCVILPGEGHFSLPVRQVSRMLAL